ncbi:MAG: ATP-binding protein [Desulfobacteraceae bacterium]|nr:MAG: ATP-binding protein [Desulfobacteraceae bacterium]
MRIKSIEAKNFKSLVDFRIELAQFNCLIGLNGSGKSTVLQFTDFVSQLVRGDVKGWLNERKWKSSDLKSKLTKKMNIDLSVSLLDEDGLEAGYWEASYSPSKNRCTRERIDLAPYLLEVTGNEILAVGGPLSDTKGGKSEITFSYEGSILSALKEDLLPKPILDFKMLMKEVKSLDLLSPEYLRQRTRESSGSLGLGGQKLAAFLYELGVPRLRELTKQLKRVYPQLENLHIRPLRSGWKQLEIIEGYKGQEAGLVGFFPRMTTEARHINDGMLRLIAILAELQSGHRFLLFDEIENGINPELVEFVIEALTSTDKQVLVTTHSPMILNYLSDDVAKSGVIYLYKTSTGSTEATPFFSIPSIGEKLTVMGPGEVFADTNLTDLTKEIQSSSEAQ